MGQRGWNRDWDVLPGFSFKERACFSNCHEQKLPLSPFRNYLSCWGMSPKVTPLLGQPTYRLMKGKCMKTQPCQPHSGQLWRLILAPSCPQSSRRLLGAYPLTSCLQSLCPRIHAVLKRSYSRGAWLKRGRSSFLLRQRMDGSVWKTFRRPD